MDIYAAMFWSSWSSRSSKQVVRRRLDVGLHIAAESLASVEDEELKSLKVSHCMHAANTWVVNCVTNVSYRVFDEDIVMGLVTLFCAENIYKAK